MAKDKETTAEYEEIQKKERELAILAGQNRKDRRRAQLEKDLEALKEEESKITQKEIEEYNIFMERLSKEDITESFMRVKPTLDPLTHDANGNEIQYERSIQRKPANTKMSYTQEHIEEINYCFSHPIYAIKNYIKIISQDIGLIDFKLYPYQAKFIQDCFAHKRLIANWARQMGKTTTSSAFMLMFTIFNENKTVAIVANKQNTAKEILDRIKLMYNYLPMWLKPGIIEWNKGSVTFDNGCKIIASATSADSIRGQSISLLYLDEFAFIPKNLVNEFIESTFPVISASVLSRIIITSTPNGKNHFYKFYEEARLGKSSFVHSHIKWDAMPGRTQAWKEERIKELGSIEKFNQEYGAEFANASDMAFKPDTIDHINKVQVQDPLYENVKQVDGLRVFERPYKGRKYLIACDVAGGKGRDASTMVVIDITTNDFTIVATYKNDEIHTSDYPAVIYNIALYYYEAYIIIENNGLGDGVANDLWYNYEYSNIFNADFTKENKTKKGYHKDIGIKTNKKNKKAGVLFLASMLDKYQIYIPDVRIVEELYTFVKNGNDSYSASTGNHDDFVMNLVLFAYLTKTRETFEMLRASYQDTEDMDALTDNVIYNEGGLTKDHKTREAEVERMDDVLYNILVKDTSTNFEKMNRDASKNPFVNDNPLRDIDILLSYFDAK